MELNNTNRPGILDNCVDVKSSSPARRYKFMDDDLGKLVEESVNLLHEKGSWESFVESFRDRECLSEGIENLPHPAAKLLAKIREQGVPVQLEGEQWSKERREFMAARGPHKSAKEYAEFVRGEMCDFHRKKFWVVLPLDELENLEMLRLSPLGVVPQRDRRPRLINDLTFSGVNQDTMKGAPPEAMQFGRTLERVVHSVRKADPRFGPVYLNKIDISDGFYRIGLSGRDAVKLACLLPRETDEPQLVAIPLSLPMGWVESPPYFCAATETVADLANQRMGMQSVPRHRLEQIALRPDSFEAANPGEGKEAVPISAPSSLAGAKKPEAVCASDRKSLSVVQDDEGACLRRGPEQRSPMPPCMPDTPPTEAKWKSNKPLAQVDVYVDDFCNAMQGDERERRRVMRILLHTLDEVFQPLGPDADQWQKEAASIKKLLKGDGKWETRKQMLGWIIDTVKQTVELPPHRAERIAGIFNELKGQRRVSTAVWHKALGELRSMALAVPGARGLFSALQTGLQQREASHRIRIDKGIRSQLDDFAWLARDLDTRPTRMEEIVPDDPAGIGACDASGTGMGGVWFVSGARPLVWRALFPADIQRKLVSFSNPSGTITNSDLELAGMIAHQDVLAQRVDCRHRTFANLGDNTPSVVWMTKGSTTTTKAPQHLLRLGALHQRHHRVHHTYDHIPDSFMEIVPATKRDAFSADLLLVGKTSRYAHGVKRAQTTDNTWDIWCDFSEEHKLDPLLANIEDPIPILSVFAQRWRDGRLAPRGNPVLSRSVEDALRQIGQTMASLGARDARLGRGSTKFDYWLKQLLDGWKREDRPTKRFKPVPLCIVRRMRETAGNIRDEAIGDMAIIGFFFLCRPGEHVLSGAEKSSPFRLQDVEFLHNQRLWRGDLIPLETLGAASGATLLYSTQKNAVEGQGIAQGLTKHHLICSTRTLERRVLHLRQHQAPRDTPLYTYYENGVAHSLRSHDIKTAIRAVAQQLRHVTGIEPAALSTQGLRSGGATAMLCANIDRDITQLVGRWKSDKMLKYLHAQSLFLMRNYAQDMFENGGFTFQPDTDTTNPESFIKINNNNTHP